MESVVYYFKRKTGEKDLKLEKLDNYIPIRRSNRRND